MKKVALTGALLVVIMIIASGLVYAGDSVSLSVSFTIPAVPGLNVPLIQQETTANIVAENLSQASSVEVASQQNTENQFIQDEDTSVGIVSYYAK